jgi:hypothetical protein
MSNSDALKAAKRLSRQWPHAKPPDPEGWLQAIADTLRRYPPALVEECVESASAFVLAREFPPTCKAVADWCDEQVRLVRSLAAIEDWQLEKRAALPQLPDNPERAAEIQALISGLVQAIRADPTPAPLEQLLAERRDALAMTRKSILARGA